MQYVNPGLYIVNVHLCRNSDEFLTIFIFFHSSLYFVLHNPCESRKSVKKVGGTSQVNKFEQVHIVGCREQKTPSEQV